MKQITDEQWTIIEPHLSKGPHRKTIYGKRLGQKRFYDERSCFNALLWMLSSGVPWGLYPFKNPSAATVYRRLKQWSIDGSIRRAFDALVEKARKENRFDLTAGFVDGTVVSAKKKELVLTGDYEEWLRESCSLSNAKDFRSQYKRTALARKRFALLNPYLTKSPPPAYPSILEEMGLSLLLKSQNAFV